MNSSFSILEEMICGTILLDNGERFRSAESLFSDAWPSRPLETLSCIIQRGKYYLTKPGFGLNSTRTLKILFKNLSKSSGRERIMRH